MIEKFQRQLQIGAWLVVAVLVLSGVWLWQSIGQQTQHGNVSDVITVSGTGKVLAKPDIAVADLAISVESDTAKTAQDDASKKSKSVVDYLKKAGIDEKDIKTSGYNIYPQYDYTNGRSRIRGYQVTQSLTVKVRDMDKANEILDGVVSAGVNQVNNLRFEIDEPEKIQAQAREKAIADANTKAKELKGQLGVSLGKIVSFSESNGGYIPSPMYMKLDSAAGGVTANSAPEVPSGENEIVVNVVITYQIK